MATVCNPTLRVTGLQRVDELDVDYVEVRKGSYTFRIGYPYKYSFKAGIYPATMKETVLHLSSSVKDGKPDIGI